MYKIYFKTAEYIRKIIRNNQIRKYELNPTQMKYPIREKEFLAVSKYTFKEIYIQRNINLKKYRSYSKDLPFKLEQLSIYIKQYDLRITDRAYQEQEQKKNNMKNNKNRV